MIAIKERPIIMQRESVNAILAGTKTQTRRVIKLSPSEMAGITSIGRCPHGQVGDRLWVRESWASPSKNVVAYAAGAECGAWILYDNHSEWVHHGLILDSPDYRLACSQRKYVETCGLGKYAGIPRGDYPFRYGWKSPMFMPRWACRILLDIVSIRVERVREISTADMRAEGISNLSFFNGECWEWKQRWVEVNGKRKGCRWEDNPWVG